jgi:phosphatidylglycerophosphatase A
VAVGFGLGLAPGAPGTAGALGAAVLGAVLCRALGPAAVAVACAAALAAGMWAARSAEADFGDPDPGRIVIDEIAGQLLALVALPCTVPSVALAFVLFRFFDVLKVFPARRLERLPGASGIMADDLLAGLYANLGVRAVDAILALG